MLVIRRTWDAIAHDSRWETTGDSPGPDYVAFDGRDFASGYIEDLPHLYDTEAVELVDGVGVNGEPGIALGTSDLYDYQNMAWAEGPSGFGSGGEPSFGDLAPHGEWDATNGTAIVKYHHTSDGLQGSASYALLFGLSNYFFRSSYFAIFAYDDTSGHELSSVWGYELVDWWGYTYDGILDLSLIRDKYIEWTFRWHASTDDDSEDGWYKISIKNLETNEVTDFLDLQNISFTPSYGYLTVLRNRGLGYALGFYGMPGDCWSVEIFNTSSPLTATARCVISSATGDMGARPVSSATLSITTTATLNAPTTFVSDEVVCRVFAAASMGGPCTTRIQGYIYDAGSAEPVLKGQLIIRPNQFFVSQTCVGTGAYFISNNFVYIDVPDHGFLDFYLVANYVATFYYVEFDPDPSDTVTPLRSKSGYFSNTWFITASPTPLDIASL